MKWAELNKKQKDSLILSVMGVVTFLVVIQNLIIIPRKEAVAAAQKVIDEIDSKVSRGESVLTRDRISRRDLQSNAVGILEILRNHLPPDVSRYTWALGKVTAISHELGLLPPVVREHKGQRYVQSRRPYEEIRDNASMWVTYAVEVDFQAGYFQVIEFLRRLHEKNPYASVGQLNLRTNQQSPEFHQVSLLIEWPIFRHEADKTLLETYRGATP